MGQENPLCSPPLLMIMEEVEMQSRRSLLQSVTAGEALWAVFVLVKWVEEKLLVVCVQVM